MPFRDFLNFRRNRNVILLDKPIRERHLLSALCSLMTVVCIIAALSMQQWAVSGSSKCDCSFGLTTVHCVGDGNTASTKACMDFPS